MLTGTVGTSHLRLLHPGVCWSRNWLNCLWLHPGVCWLRMMANDGHIWLSSPTTNNGDLRMMHPGVCWLSSMMASNGHLRLLHPGVCGLRPCRDGGHWYRRCPLRYIGA